MCHCDIVFFWIDLAGYSSSSEYIISRICFRNDSPLISREACAHCGVCFGPRLRQRVGRGGALSWGPAESPSRRAVDWTSQLNLPELQFSHLWNEDSNKYLGGGENQMTQCHGNRENRKHCLGVTHVFMHFQSIRRHSAKTPWYGFEFPAE